LRLKTQAGEFSLIMISVLFAATV